jgi:hypothetical protein
MAAQPRRQRGDDARIATTCRLGDYSQYLLRPRVCDAQSYEPARIAGAPDAEAYARLVRTGPRSVEGRWRYRVLVPYVAKPFYWLARDRARTWNAVSFGMLMANAIFVATTVCMLVALGQGVTGSGGVALLGGALYLVNFDIANYQLAGMVDAGEAFAIMLLACMLFFDKWWPLPFVGIVGALAKETFAPLAAVFALTWWASAVVRRGFSAVALVGILGMIVSGLATVVIFQSVVSGYMVSPWRIAAEAAGTVPFWRRLAGFLTGRNFWYVFLWLLPLGVLGKKRLPAAWVQASVAAALTALPLGAYSWAEAGDATRAAFNVSGAMWSMSAAAWILGESGKQGFR